MREFDDLPQLMTLLQAQSTLLRYFRHFRYFRLSRVVSASVGALRTAPRFNSHRLRIRRRRLSLLVHSGTTRVSNNDSLFILQSSRPILRRVQTLGPLASISVRADARVGGVGGRLRRRRRRRQCRRVIVPGL